MVLVADCWVKLQHEYKQAREHTLKKILPVPLIPEKFPKIIIQNLLDSFA